MALLKYANRVHETSTTVGTGTIDLDGAAFPNKITFIQGVASLSLVPYVIQDDNQFEIGYGTITAGTPDTLSRDTVVANSNQDTSKISFGAGTRDVLLDLPAQMMVSMDFLQSYSGESYLTNGGFDIWQRGTSFSADGLSADRWDFAPGGGGNVGVADRQAFTIGQTGVPGEPRYYMEFGRTSTDAADTILRQKLEGVRTLAGQEITVSYYAKVLSGAVTQGDFAVRLAQDFGTGGSPSTTVTTNFTSPALTTAWQKFTSTITLPSITGKTIGSDANTDTAILRFVLLNAAGSVKIDLANVKLETGAVSTVYRPRLMALELEACQRFFCKTFRQTVAPAQNAGRIGALGVTGASTGRFIFNWRFPVVMRIIPTIITYNPSEANSNAMNQTNPDSTPVTVMNECDSSIQIRATTIDATDADDTIEIHATADAEYA